MYERTYWLDHVIDQNGDVIQQGTPLDQAHLNNLEKGVADLSVAIAFMQFRAIQDKHNEQGEES